MPQPIITGSHLALSVTAQTAQHGYRERRP
jgi:hypothetical protein